jgi:hypothetical protein
MRSKGALIACLALSVAGCSSYAWEKRHGIDPVLDPAAIEVANNNHIRILTAFAKDANIFPSTPGDWYPVAEAGFNFIDDECRLYFNHLFFLNREREQVKAGIIATNAATAAILGVTGASTMSMAIVAEAFGLGAIATDLIAGTYLYHLPPATTLGFVKEMQLAYREGAATRRALIVTPTAAYHAIQDYLSLCLPPTIEAKLNEHVATARAIPDPATRGGGSAFGITTASPAPLTRPEVRARVVGSIVENPRVPLPETVRPKPGPGKTKPDFGDTLTPVAIREIQIALCVTPPTGQLDSTTRKAISAYLVARGKAASQIIDQRNFAFLDEAVEKVRVRQNGNCTTAGFADATAVGQSFPR